MKSSPRRPSVESSWSFKVVDAPLRVLWNIHHGRAASKPVGVIQFSTNDGLVGLGEVAEATGSGKMALYKKEFQGLELSRIRGEEDIQGLSISTPLKFGMLMAFYRWRGTSEGKSFLDWSQSFFGTQAPTAIPTSFSVPILKVDGVEAYLKQHDVQRFSSVKIKVQGLSSVSVLRRVHQFYSGPLRVDGNECFDSPEAVLAFLTQVQDLPLEMLEQPLARENQNGFRELKKMSKVPIVADESLQDGDVGSDLAEQFHGVNIKLMKTGGLRRALKQKKQALDLGLDVMVGCMVETSLGIEGVFALGQGIRWYDLDGFLLFQQDPFGKVQESLGAISVKKSVLKGAR